MDVVTRVRDLKNSAMDERDLGNWQEALDLLDDARRELERALADLERRAAETDSNLVEYRTSVQKQLYHLLGSIGGVYRRRAASDDRKPGDLEAAVKSYDEGYTIEQAFTDSYNLTQRLVARVLLRPACTSDGAPAVEGIDVRRALRAAKAVIDRQTSEKGPRNNDEYAFADAAIVAMLLGEPNWQDAVTEFTRRAPKSSYARNVTRDVLTELEEGLKRDADDGAGVLLQRVSDALRMTAQ